MERRKSPYKHWKDRERPRRIRREGDDTTEGEDDRFDWRKAVEEIEREEMEFLEDR